MPRNGTGTYSLPAGNPVVTLTTVTTTWANGTLSDVATALTQSMARNGESAATGNWPMAGFKLQNVGAANATTDYARADQVQTSALGLTSLPANPSANVYEGTLPLGTATFADGQLIAYEFLATNTGAATLSINSSTPANILRLDGSALRAGDLRTTVVSLLMWSGTGWLLLNATENLRATGPLTFNTAAGVLSLNNVSTGIHNTAYGANALELTTTGRYNTAVGSRALQGSSVGELNVAVGFETLLQAEGDGNTAIGAVALTTLTTGIENTALGKSTLTLCETGSMNVAAGVSALNGNIDGDHNAAFGAGALQACDADDNSALGYQALAAVTTQTNCTGLGAGTAVTGSNQVQLGNAATTTYAYGAVQNRSDLRDKTDVRDTALGLAFIMRLRPVDFRWKYREEGGKTGARFHHGFVAQEIATLPDQFGGYQDHKVKGGDDVLSLGYAEFIAPLVRAVQELQAEVQALKAHGR